MISTDIHKTAYDALDEMELAPDYQSEEHDFQDAVVDALRAAFVGPSRDGAVRGPPVPAKLIESFCHGLP